MEQPGTFNEKDKKDFYSHTKIKIPNIFYISRTGLEHSIKKLKTFLTFHVVTWQS